MRTKMSSGESKIMEDQGRYEFAEEEAKAKEVGLWQDKNPMPPWEYRHPPQQ